MSFLQIHIVLIENVSYLIWYLKCTEIRILYNDVIISVEYSLNYVSLICGRNFVPLIHDTVLLIYDDKYRLIIKIICYM